MLQQSFVVMSVNSVTSVGGPQLTQATHYDAHTFPPHFTRYHTVTPYPRSPVFYKIPLLSLNRQDDNLDDK